MTHIAKLRDLMPEGEPKPEASTPRTDKAAFELIVAASFARQLERELAQAKRDKAALLEACKTAIIHLERYSPQMPILIDLRAARAEAEAAKP